MSGKKLLMCVMLIATTCVCVCGAANDVSSEAKTLFEKGKYKEGLDALDASLRQNRADPLLQVDARKALGEFYERYAGNYELALTQYKQVLSAPLPADDPTKPSVEKEVARLEALATKYSRQNALLKQQQSFTSKPQDEADVEQQISQLEEVINDSPEYYRLAEACYYLGLNYMSLKEYEKACQAFDRCEQLKPAIDFYLPVKSRLDAASGRRTDVIVNTAVWGVIGVLLMLIAALFYLARPWRWVRVRHIVAGLVITVLWWVVFSISHAVLEAEAPFTKTVIEQTKVESPAFRIESGEIVNSKVPGQLFLYGLVATWGIFLLAVGTGRFKRRWTAMMVNSIVGLLLAGSLASVFYLRYCKNDSVFNSQGKNLFYYPEGALYFVAKEPEVYVLTNPKAYPNLKADVEHVKDRYFLEWVKRYCPFDHPDGETEQSKPE